jgi:hypothetical protein
VRRDKRGALRFRLQKRTEPGMIVNNTEVLGTGVVLLLLVVAGLVVLLALHDWRHRKERK